MFKAGLPVGKTVGETEPVSEVPASDFLPSSSYVVLGLLSFDTRLTGYELRQWSEDSVRFFWASPSMSQIYRELEKLEVAGFVDARDERGDGERARTTYGLTPAGRAELLRWVEDAPYEAPLIRHQAAFRLFCSSGADPAKVRAVLEAHRDWAAGLLADLAEVEADLLGDERFRAPATVATWGLRFFGAERRAIGEAIRIIDPDLDH